jgi:hypothetical protein
MQHDKDQDREGMPPSSHPRWWTGEHTSAWARIKEALRRDWEQTKHDFSKKAGRELGQNVDDTVKQMVGKEPMPATYDWSTVEPAMRYGYGAGRNYADVEFDAHEEVLEREWNDMKPARPWADARDYVRRGWDWSRRKD